MLHLPCSVTHLVCSNCSFKYYHSSSPQDLQNNGQIPYIVPNALLTSPESSEIILLPIIWSLRTTYQSLWLPNTSQSLHTFAHMLLLLPKIFLSVMPIWKTHLPDSSLASTPPLNSYSLPDPPAPTDPPAGYIQLH